jgi:hypothetical protein
MRQNALSCSASVMASCQMYAFASQILFKSRVQINTTFTASFQDGYFTSQSVIRKLKTAMIIHFRVI